MSNSVSVALQETGGSSITTLEDLVDIRNPPNRDELIRLIHRNRRQLRKSVEPPAILADGLNYEHLQDTTILVHDEGKKAEQGDSEIDELEDAASNSLFLDDQAAALGMIANVPDKTKATLELQAQEQWTSTGQNMGRVLRSSQGLWVLSSKWTTTFVLHNGRFHILIFYLGVMAMAIAVMCARAFLIPNYEDQYK